MARFVTFFNMLSPEHRDNEKIFQKRGKLGVVCIFFQI